MSEIETVLRSFSGYAELGMYEDANNELDGLPLELQKHPAVRLARLDLLVEMKRWEAGASMGESLCKSIPEELECWFKTAFCQHELKRTLEAKQTLLTAPPPIRETAVFYYNLACYETQLGDLSEGRRLLQKACEIDKRFRQDALKDPDLQPLYKA